MKIQLSNDMSEDIKRTSQELGLDRDEFVLRALKLYLDNVKLKEEMESWEKASLEDSADFFERHNL